eukprot:CAMPEP_0201577496 /NCGR_PEP_ID=MMETSP0190_2-20130828/23923_1 /ASSEMBLY_ACC=CAM_ASM_000263 /TAXON_ID=37353 /ORGANISM="Rosalina sp." /LENGTH=86 /DNA_ID=CAMNT_0048009599 /DNA_START=106 /DNA_END=366 /DNA_ORIENTATION=-
MRKKKRDAKKANTQNKKREKQIQMQSGQVELNGNQIQQQQPAQPVYTDVVVPDMTYAQELGSQEEFGDGDEESDTSFEEPECMPEV